MRHYFRWIGQKTTWFGIKLKELSRKTYPSSENHSNYNRFKFFYKQLKSINQRGLNFLSHKLAFRDFQIASPSRFACFRFFSSASLF